MGYLLIFFVCLFLLIWEIDLCVSYVMNGHVAMGFHLVQHTITTVLKPQSHSL